MRQLFLLISYIFHPLFVPLAGTVAYFMVTPKYTPLEIQSGNILPVFILTIIIPIISFFILRNLGLVNSVFLMSAKERIYPLIISIGLLLIVIIKVIPQNYTIELYYFFVGLLSATVASLILVILHFKNSLHMVGMGSILMYLINLSIHFEINIILAISAFTIFTGLVATARLYLDAHSRVEILIGLMIGLITQLLTVKFWL